MKFEIKTYGEARTPLQVFRRWVLVSALFGAVVVGLFGTILIGIVAIGGAFIGAAVGVVLGGIRAAITAMGR